MRERDQRIGSIVVECARRDAERGGTCTRAATRKPVLMASVARVFCAHHGEGEFPTRKELAAELGMTEPASRREIESHLNEALAISRRQFEDHRNAQ